MRWITRLVQAGAVVALASTAVAQENAQCAPDTILELSERILRQRSDLTGFAPPRFGAQAAYLAYYYGNIADADMLALLDRLSEGGRRSAVRGASDMALALAVAVEGVAGLERNGVTAPAELAGAFWHQRRAILLLDAGATYFALLQAVRDDPSLTLDPDDPMMVATQVVPLVVDQDDVFLRQLSENAEAAGALPTALFVAANMQDRSRAEAMIAQYADDEQFGWLFERRGLDNFAAVWVTQNMTWRSDPGPEQSALFEIMRAAVRSGPLDWTSIAVNQTGMVIEFGEMAEGFDERLAAGEFVPFADPEAMWLWQYREITAITQGAAPHLALQGFDWPARSIRHFAASGARSMEIMILLEAATPAMLGAQWPEAPALASPDEFAQLGALVARLREQGSGFVPQTDDEAMFAFELLWRTGDLDGAIALAEGHMDIGHRLVAYQDVSRRLDGVCDAVLAYPGQSVLFGGQVLYQFPPVPRAK